MRWLVHAKPCLMLCFVGLSYYLLQADLDTQGPLLTQSLLQGMTSALKTWPPKG